MSSLARLLDWWADQQGILFHVSAGNVAEDLAVTNITTTAFEDATPEERCGHIETAQRNARHQRTLMAPAEAMNVITVGAASLDETTPTSPIQAGVIPVHADGEVTPALSSAVGLGAFRSIKPDFLALSGEHEVRAMPGANHVRLSVLGQTQRTGLNVATVQRGNPSVYRTRGTSCANAMASRASLFAVSALGSGFITSR
ncbi:S8 family serine peptidase [Roseobacter sp. TSBP12]|uniref:S8 family serine peptidase n=1 Tax=Roseobacter sp. TSBP12 TaxID=1236613 RepID=UPI001D02BB31